MSQMQSSVRENKEFAGQHKSRMTDLGRIRFALYDVQYADVTAGLTWCRGYHAILRL